MTTTQRLMQAVAPIWDAYNTHPFVLGIQNGTLPQEKFRFISCRTTSICRIIPKRLPSAWPRQKAWRSPVCLPSTSR